jgi:ketosteroid isomerase-like protein
MAKRKARKASKAKKRSARRAKPAKKRAATKSAAPSLEALARKIVKATQQPDYAFVTLYTEDCTSAEPMGEPARGHAGLDEKNARWAQMQSSAVWTARNVWTGKNTICIEWDGAVQLRDGRLVNLREIAVHEMKGEKIQHERFYYNPMALAPASS